MVHKRFVWSSQCALHLSSSSTMDVRRYMIQDTSSYPFLTWCHLCMSHLNLTSDKNNLIALNKRRNEFTQVTWGKLKEGRTCVPRAAGVSTLLATDTSHSPNIQQLDAEKPLGLGRICRQEQRHSRYPSDCFDEGHFGGRTSDLSLWWCHRHASLVTQEGTHGSCISSF